VGGGASVRREGTGVGPKAMVGGGDERLEWPCVRDWLRRA
jgi:hypothetical protein